MKRLLALLVSMLILAPTALADMLIEYNDSFLESHHEECVLTTTRTYKANGPDGYVSLWESPLSTDQRENVSNRVLLSGSWTYEAVDGEIWLAVGEDWLDEVRGWAKLSECVLMPDYISFEEVFGAQFVPYDSAYGSAFDDLAVAVLWKYPGSGIVESAECEARQLQRTGTIEYCWEDPGGGLWGFISQTCGYENVWVYLTDPANRDLPADETLLPQEDILFAPAAVIPPPDFLGVGPTAVILVALVVAATAALIYALYRKRK